MWKMHRPTVAIVLFFCISCAVPISPAPTATNTATTTPKPPPTLTLTPTHTSTSTETPTSTPTKTATPDPKIEAIRKLVGDQPEDWFRWREDWVGYEIRLIFPGTRAISDIPFELKDGNGVVVGKSYASFRAQFLINDEIKEITVPYIWHNNLTGYCNFFGAFFPAGCDEITKNKNFVFEVLTWNEIGSPNWTPGEVVISYFNEPNLDGLINDTENRANEDTEYYYQGKADKLKKLFTEGDPEIGVLLLNMAQFHCENGDEIKEPIICRNDAEMIIIPGYQ